MLLPPPRSTLFPCTTLFRSQCHEHREHRDVLLDRRARLDLLDHALEAAVGESVNGYGRGLSRTHLADVGLVEERADAHAARSEEHTSELQSRFDLVCRLLLE